MKNVTVAIDNSDDDLVDNNGAEDCPLDFIERYEVFHCVSSCNRAGNSNIFGHVLYRLVPRWFKVNTIF